MYQPIPVRRRLFAKSALVATSVTAVLVGASTAHPAHADSSTPAAQGRVLAAESPERIDGRYLVTLEDAERSAAGVSERSRDLASRHGGEVTRVYSAALDGFTLETDEASARTLAADPAVARVEADQRMRASGTQANPPSWGLDRVDEKGLDGSYTYPETSTGVTAYVIDTGIRVSHEDFDGRARWGTNTVDGNDTDCNGHGTHVAGTTGGTDYGVAKQAQLVAVKVLNCQGSGTTSGVVAGVDWVTQRASGPSVANMSLGGGASATLDQAVSRSIASGVTYAVAAGNANTNACDSSPARVPEAITVGATQRTDSRSSFSNYGRCLDLFAPGSNITSAWIGGDTDENTISGTSMAAPHVAGAAALLAGANPSWSPQQIRDRLVADASDGAVANPGSGSPNKLLQVVS